MLNDNKKEVQLLRSECATLEHHATETTNDILKEIIEDISNLEKDFYKLQASDVSEMNFLK
jgi:glutamate synthase domain-containing protein 3